MKNEELKKISAISSKFQIKRCDLSAIFTKIEKHCCWYKTLS